VPIADIEAFAGKTLLAVSIDILKMFPTAAHHRAIKGCLAFSIETLPIFTVQSSRERIVWRLKGSVHVKVLIPRRIRVARIEASADEQANGDAKQM
jgi:hypothetical protein